MCKLDTYVAVCGKRTTFLFNQTKNFRTESKEGHKKFSGTHKLD